MTYHNLSQKLFSEVGTEVLRIMAKDGRIEGDNCVAECDESSNWTVRNKANGSSIISDDLWIAAFSWHKYENQPDLMAPGTVVAKTDEQETEEDRKAYMQFWEPILDRWLNNFRLR